MGKINVLDSLVYSRIAAGEVVERPRSVIKELIENSLDAGAQSIAIEIFGGGIDRIKVTDDGCGIDAEDMRKVFLPHATSKISSASDLDYIGTLGFRGEALSSIAAVSRVSVSSRVRGSELGNFLTVDNGQEIDFGEGGGAYGTAVTVEYLFEKTPARKKFLSKPKAEENEISNLISRLILANSDVAFKYTSDGKIIYQSFGKGLKDAVYSVYGLDTLDNLSEVSLDQGDLKIFGLVSRPTYSKYNRSYQTLIVNGRYINDTDISYAVYSCFKDYLMTRQYPMYILFIELPPDMVDVNIHPNKMQVRFAQQKRVVSAVRQAVDESLFGLSATVATISVKDNQSQTNAAVKIVTDKNQEIDKTNSLNNDSLTPQALTKTLTDEQKRLKLQEDLYKFKSNGLSARETPSRSILSDFLLGGGDFLGGNPTKNNAENDSEYNPKITDISGIYDSTIQYNGFKEGLNSQKENSGQNSDLQIKRFLFDFDSKQSDYKYVGKLFDTYILMESGNNFYMIDQHAAHERLLFDKLYSDVQNADVAVQALLVPYEFYLSHEDANIVDESQAELSACGLIISKSDGLKYSLTGVPHFSDGFDEAGFVNMFIEMLKTKSLSAARFIRESIIQTACKAAIKGGDDLSELEIDALLKQMAEADALYCPHGRPIIISIGKNQVEKWFKRKL